jgi:hypothetical protein
MASSVNHAELHKEFVRLSNSTKYMADKVQHAYQIFKLIRCSPNPQFKASLMPIRNMLCAMRPKMSPNKMKELDDKHRVGALEVYNAIDIEASIKMSLFLELFR